MLAEVAEEGGVTLPFEAGDLQLVNNHNCFHGTLTFTSQPATHHHANLQSAAHTARFRAPHTTWGQHDQPNR